MAARKVDRIVDRGVGRVADRGCRGLVGVERGASAATLSAHGCRRRGDTAGSIIERSGRLGGGYVEGLFDKLEEGGFGGEDLGVDFFEEGEVTNKLFRERSNCVGKVCNGWEYLDRLLRDGFTSE